jgi:hypothetical protein
MEKSLFSKGREGIIHYLQDNRKIRDFARLDTRR